MRISYHAHPATVGLPYHVFVSEGTESILKGLSFLYEALQMAQQGFVSKVFVIN